MRRLGQTWLIALMAAAGCGIDVLGSGPSEDGGVAPPAGSSNPSPTPTSAPTSGPTANEDGGAPLAVCKDLPPTWGLVAVVAGGAPVLPDTKAA